MVNSSQFKALTGKNSPTEALTYTLYGFPWFDMYDETVLAVDAPAVLQELKGIAGM